MNTLKKMDIFLLSILLSAIFWISESFIDYTFFNEKKSISYSIMNSFWFELTHPNQRELSMCFLVVSLMLLFGFISQIFINKQRFFATHDAITKAPNNRIIEQYIRQCFFDQDKKHGYIAVMKLNQLSLIHRILGIQYVNQLVSNVVDRLNLYLSENFIGMFLFGDFFFFIENKTIEVALKDLNKKLVEIFEKDVFLQGIPYHVEKNIGIARLSDAGTYDNAISMCYKALTNSYLNGDGIAIYEKSLDKEDKEKLLFIGELYTAIKKGEISIYLQPKVCLKTNSVIGFEIVSRWNHPEKGLILPDQYIKEAESSQAIHWLTKQIIRDGVNIIKEVQLLKKDIAFSFNLSSKDLTDRDTFKWILTFIADTSINPRLITIEITESAFIFQKKLAIDNIKKLSELGFKISLDDFGTGYSSLSYFKDFSVNEIKIDRSFVIDIDKHPRNQSIVKNIILISHEINALVCAEGIETIAELDCIKKLGCDIGQGYFWSKPVPYLEALKFLNNT